MAELILRAEPRTILGKKVKQLRRVGRVPAVVYGPVLTETVSVSVDAREFDRFYLRAGHSTLFTLKWEGGEQPVVIRDVQMHPVRQTPLHVDFFAPNLRVVLTASVPITFSNEPDVTDTILTHNMTELQVSALPADIPQHVDADLSGLVAAGDSFRAGDIVLPRGVEMITPEDDVVAILSGLAAVEEVEETAAEEAAAESEDGETADADAGSDSSGEGGDS